MSFGIERRLDSLEVAVCGVSRGNPGLSGAGAIVRDSSGRIVERIADFLGPSTLIKSEYEAVLRGLKAGLARRPTNLSLLLSNETVWRQLTGASRAVLADVAAELSAVGQLLNGDVPVEIRLASVDDVELAEELANIAVDSRGRRTGGPGGQ